MSEPMRVTKDERAAMWLFGDDYAQSGLSARDFYRQLSPSRRDLVHEMVDEILAAPFGTWNGAPRRPIHA